MDPPARLWQAIRRRFPPPGSHPKVWAAAIAPWVLLLGGLATSFASLSVQVTPLDSLSYEGSVGANASIAVDFAGTRYTYAEIAFLERPSCALRVYGLDQAAADRFTSSSRLPDPSTSLNCDRQRGVVDHTIVLLVFNNPFGDPLVNYSLRADLFLVSQPYAIWAFPGFAALLSGAVVTAIRSLRSGVTDLVDELAEEDAFPPGRAGRR